MTLASHWSREGTRRDGRKIDQDYIDSEALHRLILHSKVCILEALSTGRSMVALAACGPLSRSRSRLPQSQKSAC